MKECEYGAGETPILVKKGQTHKIILKQAGIFVMFSKLL